MVGLGDLALEERDFELARARYGQALPLYKEAGLPLGAANCIRRLGDIAFTRGDRQEAEAKYLEALTIYEQRREPFSIGWAHSSLSRLVADDATRSAHVAAARAAWLSIKRDDLIADLDEEFGTG